MDVNLTTDAIIPTSQAEIFIKDCLVIAGAKKATAEEEAKMMVMADVLGRSSHGMEKLSFYVDKLLEGVLDGEAEPVVVRENECVALVNAKNALGAFVGRFCMNLAVKKAKKCVIGMVSANNCNDNGIEEYYTKLAAQEGLIGLTLSNGSPLVAPNRGKDAVLGSNPIGFSAPLEGKQSFSVSFSTSAVTKVQIMEKKRQGENIRRGWALDSNGQITTDSDAALLGSLLPLGGLEETSGYKGTALAVLVECLCGILSGSNYGKNISVNPIQPSNLGQCYIAINPEFFTPEYSKRLSCFLSQIKNTIPIDPEKPVLLPGDKSDRRFIDIARNGGIRYTKELMNTITKITAKLGVDPIINVHGIPATPGGAGGRVCGGKCARIL